MTALDDRGAVPLTHAPTFVPPGLDAGAPPWDPAPAPVPAHGTALPRAAGTAPGGDDGADDEVRRDIGTVRGSDVLAVLGAIVAALSSALLLFTYVGPFSGRIGFVVVTFALFLGYYALLVAQDESGPAVRDRLVAALVHGVASLLLLALVFIVAYTFRRGAPALHHLNFFTQDMGDAGPLEPMTVGGVKHAVVGTLWMITIALTLTVPLGILCAVFLNEVRGPFSRFVRTIVEAMTALPSIVAGLFIYAMWIIQFHNQKTGLAAALALSIMMLPIIIRAADVVLRLVPGNLKEASLALGAGQWSTVWDVVLPTARSGLATAVILGAARGIGETSPVLICAGFTPLLNSNPFSGPMTSLPLATFQFVKSSQNSFIIRGFGTGATLLALVLVLFVLARVVGGRGPGNLTKRQQARRVAQSKEDAARWVRYGAGGAAGAVPAAAVAGGVEAAPRAPEDTTGAAAGRAPAKRLGAAVARRVRRDRGGST